MKKPPFNTNYPKPVEKVHVPNKIETDVEGFEKENFQTTMDEFIKSFPNPRINKKEFEGNVCSPSSCPFTYYCFMDNEPRTCSKCGREVRSMTPTF